MTTDDFIIYAVLFGSVVFFGGAAVLALAWAVRDGQFENFERSSKTIFDPDEPIGKVTDRFPENQCEPDAPARDKPHPLLAHRAHTSNGPGGTP
jgi:cbb3-type cytochrome oxidase maturation protein